ncbi:M24 family metallopeptidase [Salinicoccus kekensis]|uniref:Xaa-Pro dipeptidase n=1 Tax=Salinicoccus kekensis TaxID=714307 RepID=A0A285UTN7_9STAP|nr:Xaa-Pro peptidase family protein [Salinicoccus kekensis]SOC45210.1 Xaa-Pro dipeptidase [Salinicoccus kekensis]
MAIDYHSRLNQFISAASDKNTGLIIITDPVNIFYFTGFYADPHERYMSLIIGSAGESYLFVPALDRDAAAEKAKVDHIIPISDEEDPFDILGQHLGASVHTIGVEMNVMTVAHQNGIQSIYNEAAFVDIQSEINALRVYKSREEVEGLKKAVALIEKVLDKGLETVERGMTEADLVAEFEYLMKKYGASGPSFSTMVLSGEKAALPHGKPDDTKLEDGDFLLIDFGVITYDRYCSDITRTFVIGEADEKQKEIYDIVRRSTQAGVDAVKAGVPLKEFDIAARNVIEEAGYGEYFNNRVGHGLGIEVHEAPSIHHLNEDIAKPGMVFTIEPGIYIPGYGGVRIEEEVYINEDGKAEVLTNYPRDLREISL